VGLTESGSSVSESSIDRNQTAFKRALQQWDGKRNQQLIQLYAQHGESKGFIDTLLEQLIHRHCQVASSWLLKYALEQQQSLSIEQRQLLCQSMLGELPWQARLHFLQCLPFVVIPDGKITLAEQFLKRGLAERNKFVRAWSYNGFYLLARQVPAFQNEVQHLLQQAINTESASVKARVRQLLKRGFITAEFKISRG